MKKIEALSEKMRAGEVSGGQALEDLSRWWRETADRPSESSGRGMT